MKRRQEKMVNKMKRNNNRNQKTFPETFLSRLCKNMQLVRGKQCLTDQKKKEAK